MMLRICLLESSSNTDNPLGKATLLAGLVAAVLAVVVIAGAVHSPVQILHTGQIVDAFSVKEKVNYWGGDVFVFYTDDAKVCGTVCCATIVRNMITVKPDAYAWQNFGSHSACFCKNFALTHPEPHSDVVSGKCTP